MHINYCESCGVRVSPEDLGSGAAFQNAEQRTFCPKCAPAQQRTSAPARKTTRVPSGGTRVLTAPRQQPEQQSGSTTRSILIGSAVGLIGLALVYFTVLRKGPADKQPVATSKPEPQPAVPATKPPPAATRPPDAAPKPPDPALKPPARALSAKEKAEAEIEAYRAGYAGRKWTILKEKARGAALTEHAFRKEIKDFVSSNKQSAAGREAEEFVKKMPPLDPPLPEPNAILAGYQRDFKLSAPGPGWRYMWNDGEIGASSKYVPLIWNVQRNEYIAHAIDYPANTPAGWVRVASTGGHSGKGTEQGAGTDRFAIASYTIQAGKSGKMGILGKVHRNDTTGGTIEVRVYVNDTQKIRNSGIHGGVWHEFAANLGALKEGDTVHVGVGPDKGDGSDTYGMDFSIYTIP